MTGIAFERATADALKLLGWDVEQTRATGDYGADVIARFGVTSIAVQCKDWKGPVGFDAVKEVVYARLHYRTNIALVVSRSGFTKQAQKAAQSAGVRLLRLSELRGGCEFDRSAESARIRREHEVRERAHREKKAAQERERQERQKAEERARRATEEAVVRAIAEAARQAHEKAERERLHVESRAVWGRYDRDVATHKYKLAVYEFRWMGLILGGTSVAITGVNTVPGADALAWLSIVLVLFWLVLFVLIRPGTEPRTPPMSRPLDLFNPAATRLHAGDKFAQNESADLTSTSSDRPRVSTMTWWCMGCEAGLRLPSGREGIVICPKCGTRNWART